MGSDFLKNPKFLAAVAFQILCLFAIAGRYWYVETTGDTYVVKAVGVDPRDLFRGDYVRMAYGPMSSWSGQIDASVRSGDRLYVVPEVRQNGDDREFVLVKSVSLSEPSERPFLRARAGSVDYSHPEYVIRSGEKSERFLNQREYVYQSYGVGDYESGPKTQFSSGSGVLVDRSASGSVEALYADMEDCKSNWFYSSKIPGDADETTRAAFCASLEKGSVESVSVSKTVSIEYGNDRFFVKEDTGHAIESSIREGDVYAVWKVSDDGTTVLNALKIEDTVIE